MKSVLTTVLILATLSGCTSVGNQSLKNETQDSVKSKIIKGKTTKHQVLKNFGEPDSRNLNDGEEQWSYTMYNSQVKGTSFIPVVGFLMGGASTKTKSLTINFKGEVVNSYSFSSGDNNINTGVF